MALDINLNVIVNNDCTGFTVQEFTGAYDSPDNVGGWGLPNAILDDVATSIIKIKNQTTKVVYEDINYTHSDDVDYEFLVTLEDLIPSLNNPCNNSIVSLQDGLYCFEFITILNNNAVYNSTIKVLSLSNIQCKLKQVALSYIEESECSDCIEDLKQGFLEAKALYDSIQYAFQCGNFEDVNRLILHLCEVLENINCKNC